MNSAVQPGQINTDKVSENEMDLLVYDIHHSNTIE